MRPESSRLPRGVHTPPHAASELDRPEETLQDSQNKYRVLFEDSADACWLLDDKGFLDCNSAALRMFGFSTKAEFKHPADISPLNQPDGTLSRTSAEKRISAAFLKGKNSFEWLHCRKNGDVFPAEVSLSALSLGGRPMLMATVRDITERKRVEDAMSFKTALLEAQSETTIDGILVVDESGHIVLVNRQFGLHFEVPEEVLSTRDSSVVLQHATKLVEAPESFFERIRYLNAHRDEKSRDDFRLKNGKTFDRYSAPFIDSTGRHRGRIWYFRDITDRIVAEEKIHFLAYFDALTKLPNRILLKDRLLKALAVARRRNERVALLFANLDRFKLINDSLGRTLGDRLLEDVAERLRGCTREQDTLARVGSDEFVIVLSGVKSPAEAAAAAGRIVNALARKFVVQGHSVNAGCSLGVSMFPEHGEDSETLIKNANQAMYCAKENGRNNFRFFSDELNMQAVERLNREKDLRLALEREEFFLVYQPQMNIVSGEITGLEALIRWQHPELGLVPPDKFIGVAEDSGLILQIGEWVLQTACRQARKWQDDGLPRVPVAVNVSAVQFRQVGFCALIRRVLLETRLAPRYLELELTESLLLSNEDVVFSVLQELKEMGLTLAIDDFGTGYSSFRYLKSFRVNKLKIDRSFIRDIGTDPGDAAITAAIISMARSLNLKVIAEGVENEAQMSFLRKHQCDEIQGYYFSKPIAAIEVAGKLLCEPAQRAGAVTNTILLSAVS